MLLSATSGLAPSPSIEIRIVLIWHDGLLYGGTELVPLELLRMPWENICCALHKSEHLLVLVILLASTDTYIEYSSRLFGAFSQFLDVGEKFHCKFFSFKSILLLIGSFQFHVRREGRPSQAGILDGESGFPWRARLRRYRIYQYFCTYFRAISNETPERTPIFECRPT